MAKKLTLITILLIPIILLFNIFNYYFQNNIRKRLTNEILLKSRSFQEVFSRYITLKFYMEDFLIRDSEINMAKFFNREKPPNFNLIAKFDLDTIYYSAYEDNIASIIEQLKRESDPRDLDQPFFLGIYTLADESNYLSAKWKNGLFYLFALKLDSPIYTDQTTNISDFLEKYHNLNSIAYIGWQDEKGIIAASPQFLTLSKINNDSFFTSIDSISYREYDYLGAPLFETVQPFKVFTNQQGYLRLGYYQTHYEKELKEIRLILFLIFFIFISLSAFLYFSFWHRQKYQLLSREYYNLSNYTGHILNSIKDAILVLDDNLTPLYYNKAFNNLFPKVKSHGFEDIKKSFFDSNNGAGSLDNFIKQKDNQGEITIEKSKYSILYEIVPFQDSQKKHQWIVLLKDITQYKKLENRTRNEERMSLLGRISSMVAHEIRNPLNTIGMIIQRMEMEFEPKQGKSDFVRLNHIISEEVKRLNSIVTKFLEYGRMPRPKITPFYSLDFFHELREISAYWQKEKSFKLIYPQNETTINGDRNQLKQVFLNLLTNSYHALPKTKGEITISLKKTGKSVIIEFKDNGAGIPENARNKIFDLYFSTKSDGSGFGLPISKRIIEEHGGKIQLKETSSQGTIFIIEFPN